MRVLVTRHRDHLGKVLVPHRREAAHRVIGVDTGWRSTALRYAGDIDAALRWTRRENADS